MADISFDTKVRFRPWNLSMSKPLAIVRIFFLLAIFTASLLDLVGGGALAMPLVQLAISASVGLIGVVAARRVHIV